MVKLAYSLVYSHLTNALLAWGRSGRMNAAKIENAHRRACKLLAYYNHRILTFHSIYDYFALLNAFNTNTLNFYQYFKDKLSSHQPSRMHNTRHRTNSNFKGTVLVVIRFLSFFLLWLKIVMVSEQYLKISGLYDENCARGMHLKFMRHWHNDDSVFS